MPHVESAQILFFERNEPVIKGISAEDFISISNGSLSKPFLRLYPNSQ